MPSSTSGRGGRSASEADAVRTCTQKLWKLATVRRAAVAAPTAAWMRSRSSRAALTL